MTRLTSVGAIQRFFCSETKIDTLNDITKSMDIRDFAKRFPDRMDAVRDYLEGEGVKVDIGRIAIEHTEENFRLEDDDPQDAG